MLRTWDTSDEATRTAIYGVLGKIGTGASVFVLQQALLERTESEQQLAKQALDAVYERIKALPAEHGSPVNSHRIFQQRESSAEL